MRDVDLELVMKQGVSQDPASHEIATCTASEREANAKLHSTLSLFATPECRMQLSIESYEAGLHHHWLPTAICTAFNLTHKIRCQVASVIVHLQRLCTLE